MKSGSKHRRTVLLFITLIVAAVLLAASIQPFLLIFLGGLATGFLMSLVSIIWLLTK